MEPQESPAPEAIQDDSILIARVDKLIEISRQERERLQSLENETLGQTTQQPEL